MKQTILVAGATGMLGSRIAHHLLQREDAIVRLLFRPGLEGKKRVTADLLAARGAEVIEGDLADHAALDRATRGVDVIVSAVQGGTDVIVDGFLRTSASTCSRRPRASTPRSTPAPRPTRLSRRSGSNTSTCCRARSWACSSRVPR